MNLNLTSDEMGVLLSLTAEAHLKNEGKMYTAIWQEVSREFAKTYFEVLEKEKAGK
jgi:hypothetical protein